MIIKRNKRLLWSVIGGLFVLAWLWLRFGSKDLARIRTAQRLDPNAAFMPSAFSGAFKSTPQQVIEELPDLDLEDIQACLKYASRTDQPR